MGGGVKRRIRWVMTRRHLHTALLAMGLVLLLAACDSGSSGAAGPTATTAGGPPVTSSGTPPAATATPTTITDNTPGAQVGASDVCAQTPNVTAQLPSSIPAYPGAQLKLGSSSGGNGSFGLCTTDSVTSVAQFYTHELPTKGWQIAQNTSIGNAQEIQATKGTNGNAMMIIEPDPLVNGDTAIIITTGGV